MFAAVDLGSDGFRLHIGEPCGSNINIVRSAIDPVRLAEGIDGDGMLSESAQRDTLRCLAEFRAILSDYPLQAVRVIATSALRAARNAETFLPVAERAIGHPIEIISGEEEGRLVYMGVARAVSAPHERRLVIDLGSSSTELALGQGEHIALVESFGIGAHRQGTSFFAEGRVNATSFDAAVLSARARLHDAALAYRSQQWDAAYGASGTLRAISEIIGRRMVGDRTLSYSNLVRLRDLMLKAGHVEALALPDMPAARCLVLAGGIAVLMGVMEELAIERITPVNAGLRLGVLSDLQLQATHHDRRDASVLACLRRFGANEQRAGSTAAIARSLYDKLTPKSDRHYRYLWWAALLHEIGQAVSHSGAHRHGAYLVQNADLPGFTAREQATVASLVLAQKGNLGKIQHLLADADFARAVLALRLAVMCLHAGTGDDLDGLQLHMESRIVVQAPPHWLRRYPTLAWVLEKEEDYWDEIDVPFVLRTT